MRILVIRFSSLGDVVLATAPVLGLATKFPSAEITVATKEDYAPLFDESSPQLRIRGLSNGQSLSDYRQSLGVDGFDLVVDLHGSLRSRLLTSRLKCDELRRVKKSTYRRWRMVWSKKGLNQPLSVVNSYLAAAQLPENSIGPRINLSASERGLVAERRLANPRTLGIGWGAKHPTKAVPSELWHKILSMFAVQSMTRLKIFGLESDRAQITDFVGIAQPALGDVPVELSLGLPLPDVMVDLASCAAFVSSDSGLMHVTDALGIPTFGIFGPTHPALGFAPVGERSRALHAGTWCSPCHRHGSAPCFRERRFCFDEIDASSVAMVIEDAMSETRKSK